jgi:hypothetical protein
MYFIANIIGLRWQGRYNTFCFFYLGYMSRPTSGNFYAHLCPNYKQKQIKIKLQYVSLFPKSRNIQIMPFRLIVLCVCVCVCEHQT